MEGKISEYRDISYKLFNKAERNNSEQVALGELDPSISI